MDRANQWLRHTDAKWSTSDYRWRFPSGASLQFGYLEKENDKYRYQSAEFQYIGFDELTQFTELQYRYLFSRLRRLEGSEVPLRMRSATNPGGIGHEWVKRRFIGRKDKPVREANRLFISAKLADNPSLDQGQYLESLSQLDAVTRQQLQAGDWEVDVRGGKFQRSWFQFSDNPPTRFRHILRYWDLASTSPKPGEDPDYTVGTKMAVDESNQFWVLDVTRFRGTPAENENTIRETADLDGVGVEVWMEQETGASGKSLISHYQRNILYGYSFRSHRPSGQKEIRANPISAAAEGGNVFVVPDEWTEAWLDELTIFPDGAHDDQVDSLSGAHYILTRRIRTEEYNQEARQRYAYT